MKREPLIFRTRTRPMPPELLAQLLELSGGHAAPAPPVTDDGAAPSRIVAS